MKLVWKLAIPQMCIVVCLGIVSFVVINSSFTSMHERYVRDVLENCFKRITANIETRTQEAVEQTSVFVLLPAVLRAYDMALGGNIDDGNSPQSQAARELLRKELAPMLDSYSEQTGKKLQLHFHLPNGRSLVRLWRDKQTRIKGAWLDVSDDISTFRPTVMDVNRHGKAVMGIEPGSGGFAIRGVVPVKTPDGRQLGSAEVLQEFDPILDAVTEEGKMSIALYANKELLHFSVALQDSAKYPLKGDFVRITEAKDKSVEALITPALLSKGINGSIFERHGAMTLATLPIADYKGKQIGVIVCAMNTELVSSLANTAEISLALMLAGMAIAPFIALLLGLRIWITGPLIMIKAKIQDIAEDRADLSEQILSRQKDEIGELVRWFNVLTAKLGVMLDEMDRYVSMLNTVPDPIFVVDEHYRMLMANRAAYAFLGIDGENITSCYCREAFATNVCNTAMCPITRVKQLGTRIDADTIEMVKDGRNVFIKPSANVLLDSKGNKVGYVEVARIVTDLVEAERAVHEKLDHIHSVHVATREAASHLKQAASKLDSQFGDMQEALDKQQGKLRDSATAMTQMHTTAQQVAKNASGAAEQSLAAREKAERGANIVGESIQAILRVHEHASSLKLSMHELDKQAQAVETVLGVISDIADQTNLLALNAAIEAARAGESGRGFAVVAAEVRKLAEKTMQTTDEVDKAIATIQRGAQDAGRLVDEAGDLVEHASGLASLSGEALQSIVELVNASSGQVGHIAAAAEEQSATSAQINRTLDEVAGMTSEVISRMAASTEAVHGLSVLSDQLDSFSSLS